MIEVLRTFTLPDFPSGSALSYFKGRLYLIGDDAKNLLVLDVDYNTIDSIVLFEYPHMRIAKVDKADFETSTVVNMEGKDYLLVLGSASRKNRRKGLLVDLEKTALSPNEERFQEIDYAPFIKRLEAYSIEEINFEGSAAVGDYFILSNRANDSHRDNSFIVTSKNFWKEQNTASISVLKIDLSVSTNLILGISELAYVEEKDLMLLTFSDEHTNNSYDDGEIGDSYIGWIETITKKLDQSHLELNGLVKLSEYDKVLSREKIEGFFVQSIENKTLIVHLVSDNDQGKTKLFKIKMDLS